MRDLEGEKMNKATLRKSTSNAGAASAKLWLRSCPRCQGDLYEEKDMYGRFIACLQCAYYLSEAEEVLLKYLTNRSKKMTAKTATEATAPKLRVLVGGA